ncbi:hypothetical protein NY2A_b754R [Paramecium bursaria Chlorella virus NY2A]|uniref:Uncharacterized protein b754R n=1 Tax=Paramecium bursaria Chlorella virus NY2A TaxID=46021 RepID=A7IXS9_PBCVN|nr:hypothetical protein NY2A_b754R [Paramecium bursaria Chlorella virus NY2A]ABT15153.1 hypothetical protein NY2A_b754R [Paramecium bursaria Chlorella virus NY2A]
MNLLAVFLSPRAQAAICPEFPLMSFAASETLSYDRMNEPSRAYRYTLFIFEPVYGSTVSVYTYLQMKSLADFLYPVAHFEILPSSPLTSSAASETLSYDRMNEPSRAYLYTFLALRLFAPDVDFPVFKRRVDAFLSTRGISLKSPARYLSVIRRSRAMKSSMV